MIEDLTHQFVGKSVKAVRVDPVYTNRDLPFALTITFTDGSHLFVVTEGVKGCIGTDHHFSYGPDYLGAK